MEKTDKIIIKAQKEDSFIELSNLLSDYKNNKNKQNEDKIRKFLRTLESAEGKVETYKIVYTYVTTFLLAKAYFIIGELDELPVMTINGDEMEVYEKD